MHSPTHLRSDCPNSLTGPKTRKRYLLVACTKLLTYYFLGDRSMATFAAFVFPDLAGVVVVHDRYQNHDAFPGVIHQLC
jgi:transposase